MPATEGTSAENVRPRDILLAALAFGLLGGFLEAASHFARYAVHDSNIPLGRYMLWMPAAANAGFFLLAGILVLGVRKVAPKLVTPARLVGLFVMLAVMAGLRTFDNLLGVFTVDVLALGVAVQAARAVAPRAEAARRMVARLAVFLFAAATLLGVAIETRAALVEGRMLAALPAVRKGTPNVLLLVLDTVRRFNLSTYGYERPTSPSMTALAAGGVRFRDAIAPAPWTLPSHASMMTGRWAHELSASWAEPLDDRDSTLAEALGARGYRTGGFVANISYAGQSVGIDRGFAHFDGVRLTLTQIMRSAAFTSWLAARGWIRPMLGPYYKEFHRKTAAEVNAALLDWLDRGPGEHPFFVFLNYFDAHDSYLPQPPFDTAFAEPAYPPLPPRSHPGKDRDATPRSQRGYDQAIAYLDHEIGALLRALEARGVLANTLVIVTSDHGEEFGEHGMYGHGHTLYLPGLAVPLLMALPGRVPAGQVIDGLVSLRDLPATVLDLTDGGGGSPFPGGSLARFWREGMPEQDTVLVQTRYARRRPEWDATSRGDLQGALYDSYTFLRDAEKRPEFFDFRHDPAQSNNLAPDSARAGSITALQAFLDHRMGAPRHGPSRKSP